MFVRKKRSSSNPNTYIQLIESYRLDGKVRQKVIKHIGTASEPQQLEQLIELGNQLKNLYSQNSSQQEIDSYYQREMSKIQGHKSNPSHCIKVGKQITGIHDIYGSIFDGFNLINITNWPENYYKAFKDIVMARIASPASKKASAQILEEDFQVKHSLNTIYRMMDKLDTDSIDGLQHQISKYNEKLLGNKIKVLFYDVTTIYFESFTEDDLKKLGYSKDNKFNQPQIVLTLLTTEQGLPLGYQLLPGNTYEGHTLIDAIDKWKTIYPNQKFVLVADSGMLNDNNLVELDKKNIEYIVCARIKNLPKASKQELLDWKKSLELNQDFYHKINFKNRNLILSYKLSRAKKDKFDREKALDRLYNKVSTSKNPANLISNYGYKKYIEINGDSKISINQSKVTESERWDGLHGLITNIKDMSPQEAYNHYKNLWQIEDSFRINKTDLKIRPIFHWKENRVHAHIAISYVAYACYKAVEYIVKRDSNLTLSHREIKNNLLRVGIYILQDTYTKDYFAIPELANNETSVIYQVFNKTIDQQAYCCTLSMAV